MSRITKARKPSTGPIFLAEDNPWKAALIAKSHEYERRLNSVQHMHPEMQCYMEPDSFLKYHLTSELLTNKMLPDIHTLREQYRANFGGVMSVNKFDFAFDRAYNVVDDYVTTGGEDCVDARTGASRKLETGSNKCLRCEFNDDIGCSTCPPISSTETPRTPDSTEAVGELLRDV